MATRKRAREDSEPERSTPPAPRWEGATALVLADGTPTRAGLLLECVRQSGCCNMITEWKRACLSALALGVYLGQPIHVDTVRLSFEDYVAAHKNVEYSRRVRHQAEGMPGSSAYAEMVQREVNFKALVHEAEDACRRWALEARDMEGEPLGQDDFSLIKYGAWRLLDEGRLSDYVPKPVWKY